MSFRLFPLRVNAVLCNGGGPDPPLLPPKLRKTSTRALPGKASTLGYTKTWVVSEPKIGTLSQCLAVARYVDPAPSEKTFIAGRGIWRVLDKPLFKRSETPPNLLVSCGFRSEKRVKRIKAAFAMKPFSVHLQKPKIDAYDMVFVSRHDWTPELEQSSNYHKMLGVPHRFSPEFWNTRRAVAREKYAPDGREIAVVLVGGANGAYAYDEASLENIKKAILEIASRGWRVLVSVSRRSTADTQLELAKLNSGRIQVWDRMSENPYEDYLAAGDAFLIAKDSITMPCEALSTSKPVYALELTKIPGPRLEKFEWYHRDLQNTLNLTRPFTGDLSLYEYDPPREAERLARIIKRHLPEGMSPS